jgi:hypothetical protein
MKYDDDLTMEELQKMLNERANIQVAKAWNSSNEPTQFFYDFADLRVDGFHPQSDTLRDIFEERMNTILKENA